MATGDVAVGDVERPTLVVSSFDETTSVALKVTAPDGTVTTPSVTSEDDTPEEGEQTWTAAPVTYDQAGTWVLQWTVTGTGEDTVYQRVYVVPSPVAGGPTWLPGRSRVANYLPGRTLPRDSETHELTFTSRTLPTGVQVDQLIADGAAWLQARTGTIDEHLHENAAVAVALWAAAAVERGYPVQGTEDRSLQRADALYQQALAARDDLARINRGRPSDPAASLAPIWSFPPPVPWGDLDL